MFDNFSAGMGQWNVRDNFSTIDTARGQPENVIYEDGKLHLYGTWLDAAPVAGGPQGFYTHDTGYIDQRNLSDAANPSPFHYSQQYGRWEARQQTPTGPNTRGALAAFWLRCDSTPGEMDIMEAWGGGGTMASDWTTYVKDSAWTTLHSSTNSGSVNGKPYRKTFWRHYQHGGPRPQWDTMRTYGFEYTPDHMSADVGGVTLFNVTPASTDPVNGGTCAWLWDSDFFGSPLHIRMNLHIGPSPSYWGLPDPDNKAWTVDPLDYAVEYVAAWEYEE
jgi:hypothetical protein